MQNRISRYTGKPEKAPLFCIALPDYATYSVKNLKSFIANPISSVSREPYLSLVVGVVCVPVVDRELGTKLADF
jgi:hypothetical protein